MPLFCPTAYAEDDPVAAAEFKETNKDRDFIKEVIDLTNEIFGISSDIKLVPSWEAAAKKPGAEPVKVYLIAPTNPAFLLQVPFKSCRCIFIQVDAYRKNLFNYSERLEQMLKIDDKYMLVFMLLHEIGHISQHDDGHYDERQPDYNFNDNVLKQKELIADRFATNKLIEAATTSGFAALKSQFIQMEISKASWNLQVVRTLENLGGTTLCSKHIFADRGASHPNFELRILNANHILTNTPETANLLAVFENCRINRPSAIIYKAE